jgi:hypothetical protein
LVANKNSVYKLLNEDMMDEEEIDYIFIILGGNPYSLQVKDYKESSKYDKEINKTITFVSETSFKSYESMANGG